MNHILERETDVVKFKEILKNFDSNKTNLNAKKGIYLYGNPGSGKTTFVINVLKEMDYDVIKYDAGDIRNKSIIDTITKHNMSDKNIMSLFHKKIRKIVIVMDEIDGMNNGDKGGINSLIKLIRPKKTKKQKLEEITMNPIICIGNYHVDKRIKELMKVCYTMELFSPTLKQVTTIIEQIMPDLRDRTQDQNQDQYKNMIPFIQGDLRKLDNIYTLFKHNKSLMTSNVLQNVFQLKSHNDDTKKITQKLIGSYHNIREHLTLMNETDRTIVGLLWHENIIDTFANTDMKQAIPFYLSQLDNMCFSDYIDRITFQKQIWQFNEMSSLIKTFKNNKLYHERVSPPPATNATTATTKRTKTPMPVIANNQEIRFTKVLTKYSTEYNNSTFIQNLCQQLGMDKKDMFAFFLSIKAKMEEHEILALFENYEINKLDVHRIYRYLEKYTKENAKPEDDSKDDEDILVEMEDSAAGNMD